MRLLFLPLLLLAVTLGVDALRNINIDPVSRDHPTELHHSLHTPLDKSQVYWNFGGATVLTKNFIRLTPSTQDRRGWLWNEYPLESENWEVEFKLEIHSKPHFGGDGMAFWVLAGDQDPAFSREPDFLNGPIFGLKNDFQGFGLAFDIYDNDNRRNNPSLFILNNPSGDMTHFNHDNDYEDDMLKTLPISSVFQSSKKHHTAFKCVADFRNTGKPASILIKYLHQVLHVYVDTNEGSGYRFCLAVQMDQSFVDYHIAFTAATGQVADNMDIKEITTRYLLEKDKDFDDDLLDALAGGNRDSSTFGSVSTLLMFLLSAGLTGFAVMKYRQFQKLTSQHLDELRIAQDMNDQMVFHHGVHAFFTLLCIVTSSWFTALINLPLVCIRAYLYKNHMHMFTSASVRGGIKGHSGAAGGRLANMSISTRLTIAVAIYSISALVFTWNLF